MLFAWASRGEYRFYCKFDVTCPEQVFLDAGRRFFLFQSLQSQQVFCLSAGMSVDHQLQVCNAFQQRHRMLHKQLRMIASRLNPSSSQNGLTIRAGKLSPSGRLLLAVYHQGLVFGLARAESVRVNFDRKGPTLGPVLDGDSTEHRASPPTRAMRIEPVSVSYLKIPLRAGAGRCQWNPAFRASE
jgi:hypothetical protein